MDATEDELTVWCGNLPSQVDEELLYELFLQVAPLKKVRIPTDKAGKCMNYGFVTFKHQVSVQYAVDMFNNIQLYDRTIIVRSRNLNKPQQQQQQQQQQAPPQQQPMMMHSGAMGVNDMLQMSLGLGMGLGMVPMPMIPVMMPTAQQQQQHHQHDYHSKDRNRHGHHNDKPYRHHSSHRSSSRNNNWSNNRYRY